MVSYRYLNRAELRQWQSEHPVQSDPELEDMHLAYFQHLNDEDLCAVIAVDDGKLVGRTLLAHSTLMIEGGLHHVLVGQNLYVTSEYRSKAVGVVIIMKVLALGLPFIEASVSWEYMQVLDKWGQFRKVDASPIYQVGVDRKGILYKARSDFQRVTPDNTGRLRQIQGQLKALLGSLSQLNTVRDGSMPQVVAPGDIAVELERLMAHPRFPVQVPWDRLNLSATLEGSKPDEKAWLVKLGQQDCHLLVMQVRRRDTSRGPMLDAHLTEIYPPAQNLDEARPLLAFAMGQAERLKANLLHVYAMSPSLNDYCVALGLHAAHNKSIYVAIPAGSDGKYGRLLDAGSGWCRGVNEDQFETAFVRPGSEPPLPSLLV